MNKELRKKAVVAMEFLARAINDEDVLNGWLMCGVADGDIPQNSLDPDYVDEAYIDDDTFKDLISCFLRRMSAAYKSGGLYIDKIVSDSKE